MYRATTPTHTFTLPVNPADCDEIQVTYKQGDTTLEFHLENNILPPGMAVERNNVEITLTQYKLTGCNILSGASGTVTETGWRHSNIY